MVTRTVAIFVFIDDILKSVEHKEDSRRKFKDSELITTAIIAARYFGGHMEHAQHFMKGTGLMPKMLDKSRFSRRLHAVMELIYDLFMQLGLCFREVIGEKEYILDSFPVPVCDNIRISNCKLLQGKKWRGKQCSMRRYFYGVKVQLLTNAAGIPVEFCFVPGSQSDVKALNALPFSLPAESKVYADSAYTNYLIEDDMKDAELIEMRVVRKSNSKRKDIPYMAYLKECMRKRIETTISEIKGLFLRKIHAVTFRGFLLKLILFIFCFQLDKIFR